MLAGADITMPRTPETPRTRRHNRSVEFPLAESSGFLVRDANRAFQRLLEKRHRRLRAQARPVVFPARSVDRGRAVAARTVRARRHHGADHRDRAAQHGEGGPRSAACAATTTSARRRCGSPPKAKRLRDELLRWRAGSPTRPSWRQPRRLAQFRRVIAQMTRTSTGSRNRRGVRASAHRGRCVELRTRGARLDTACSTPQIGRSCAAESWISSASCSLVRGAGMNFRLIASGMMRSRPTIASGDSADFGK